MTLPKRKNGRRKITVEGSVYWWNPTKWEATEYIRIFGESGRGSMIRVYPLQIMTPKDIVACIKHAIGNNWSTDAKHDLWLGFDDNNDGEAVFQIPPNSTVTKNKTTGRWELPKINDT